MRCEVAERELSARMDGEASLPLPAEVHRHIDGCPSCRAFESGAAVLRDKARFEVADPVPAGLLSSIMERIESQGAPRPTPRLVKLRPVLAAFLLGAITSGIVVGGLAPRRPRSALASEIPGLIAAASATVSEYRAVFDIVEHNFRPEMPVRRFESSISYQARERFRAVTSDLNNYPSGSWPRNNLSLEVEEGRWRLESPVTCPRLALPACSGGGTMVRAVTGREPFDSGTALPTDIILPLRTLAGTARVEVVGGVRIAGRDGVRVRLSYADAQPLFAFLQSGGAWRPFHPSDEVILSLDAASWFPLAYEVVASGGPEREQWAAREGLTADRPGAILFQATARTVEFKTENGEAGIAGPMDGASDGGFVDLPMDELAARVGYRPLEPEGIAWLAPYRTGAFADPARRGEALVSYTNGLVWVKIRETRSWEQPALFGNVGSLAAPVDLPDGGIAYYEPATETLGRRLSIHAAGWDLYLESNLPPEDLLEVAAALPGEGLPAPREWSIRRWPGGIVREQISLEEAMARAPYLALPTVRPKGYEVAAVQLVTAAGSEGVTVFLRRPGMEPGGVGIRIHQAPSQGLPPPMDPGVSVVKSGKLQLRYSPERGEIEWVEGGIYRSIGAPALELPQLAEMARSMRTVK